MRSEPVGSFRISFLPATEGAFTGSPFVAEPGTSEHQSGLALDVSCPSIHMELSERFSATGEGRWLKKNAPLYGFILRYPKSKEEITGIPYEPWHIRYVTKPLASWLTITNLTLEEYHCFPSRCPHPPDLQLLASTSDVYILICTHFSVHLMHFTAPSVCQENRLLCGQGHVLCLPVLFFHF